MTPSKLHSQLTTVDRLFHAKNIELDKLINNLQLVDVKDDSAFSATTARLKQQHLLQPIQFDEPKLGSHRPQSKKLGSTNWADKIEDVITVTVNIPFTGSPEVFQYLPTSFRFSSSDSVVFQPTGNIITLEVDLRSLDKEKAFEKTATLLKTTKSLINQLNPTIIQWSADQEKRMDVLLTKKRMEIINFYT